MAALLVGLGFLLFALVLQIIPGPKNLDKYDARRKAAEAYTHFVPVFWVSGAIFVLVGIGWIVIDGL